MQQVPMTDVVKSTRVKLSLQNANISIRQAQILPSVTIMNKTSTECCNK